MNRMSSNSINTEKLIFGCARLGNLNRKDVFDLIEECIRNKILHFDTAPSYGSEKLIGEVLRGVDNIIITSKVGLPRIESNNKLIKRIYKKSIKSLGKMSPFIKNRIYSSINKKQASEVTKRILSMDEIMFDLEKTLTNINKSMLDILLIHEPDQFIIDDALIEIFENLKKEGLIARYGLGYNRSNFDMPRFGDVRQYLYNENINISHDSINIVHGLIRASILKGNHGSEHSNFINDFLAKDDSLSVLFSASETFQIKEICSNI